MIRIIVAALVALTPSAALAQQAPTESQPQLWLQSDTQIASTTARTAFPRVAGPVSLVSSREFSNEGQGIDTALIYRSDDGEVTATVYAYLPGLAHSGLAAYATDNGIRMTSTTPVRAGRPTVVAAGGVLNAAIRIDYENYRGMDSSAAFIKAGRWIIKLRVSGREGRRADVDAAMAALLEGIEFGQANPAFPAAPLTVTECPSGTAPQGASLLADPPGAEIAAHGFLATFDGGGNMATNESGAPQVLPSRISPEMCLSSNLRLGEASVPILRGPDGEQRSVDGRTRLIAVINDAGTALEVVHAQNLGRYVLLLHQIGSTAVLGSFDGVPSDQQVAEILSNPRSEAARVRVPVIFPPGQGPQMHLPGLPPQTRTRS